MPSFEIIEQQEYWTGLVTPDYLSISILSTKRLLNTKIGWVPSCTSSPDRRTVRAQEV